MTQNDKRKGQRIASALVHGGIVAAGVGLGLATFATPSGDVEAGERNYVRSVAPDAVAGVRLDEVVTIQFNAAVLPSSVGPDTILIRTGLNAGEQARGRYLVGAFMYDRSVQRRVVVRAEAVQEYFQLIRGLSRADATRRANRVIARIERSGRIRRLARIDRALVNFFGPSYGAGTRLDDETTFATYPPRLAPGSDLEGYRRLIAGDDDKHEDYLVNGNQAAFDDLAANTEYERFHHSVDPATGISAATSVLRTRQYRRVLISRRNRRRVMFVPDIPIRADLADSGMQPARAYSVTVPASQPGVFNTVLTRRGRRPLLQSGGRDFSTLFTTIPTTGGVPLYLDNEARTGIASLQKPRIINLTPPNGETFVDPTTDYEDPDDQFSVPLPARRTFTIRLRFAQPLDPRQINTTNFLLSKTDGNVPVAIGTFLNQSRLGIVEVEVTPATNLDPESQYTLVVRGSVASLGGELLGDDKTFSFTVGPGDPPLDRLKDTFLNVSNRADPNNDDTLGDITTALWRAPPLFDPPTVANPDGTGRLVATFMPFLGDGIGAPYAPNAPGTQVPGSDPPEFVVYDLFLEGGDEITYVTEQLDPLAPDFGDQIEYEYRSVEMDGSTARVLGRYPLVLRSQTYIKLRGAAEIDNSGQAGFNGTENADITFQSATGGIGGRPGGGGFAGGDGAFAPVRAADGTPLTGSGGEFLIDPAKFDGSDGSPTFARGGGAGGFSGDHEAPNIIMMGTELPEASPDRIREAGGGGGHATVGGDGDGRGASGQLHTEGHQGGAGGPTFGLATMADQPLNDRDVPTMGLGCGGAGGGGGGGEDDLDLSGAANTIDGSDSGGGGGGGGGGGVHLVARDLIQLDNAIVDCRGGKGGDTRNADNTTTGQGAPGGHGAGGSIWMQCYGDIQILNGSLVQASGGQVTVDNAPQPSVGRCVPSPIDIPAGSQRALDGNGGDGGLGYLRFEDANGAVEFGLSGQLNQAFGVVSQAMFRPDAGGGYPSHATVPMVVEKSVAYSRWFNSQLDTPTYVALFNAIGDLTGPDTAFFDPDGFLDSTLPPDGLDDTPFKVDIEVQGAPVDVARPGRPNLFLKSGFEPLATATQVNGNRFLQFKVTFTMPLNYLFHSAYDRTMPNLAAAATLTPRPYVDCISISIELN